MRRQPMAYARSLYLATFGVAALAIALFANSVLHRAGVVVHGSSPGLREERVDIPSGWATMPSVARWEADNVLSGRGEDAVGADSVISQARFGEMFVRYTVTRCGWGGSACAGSAPSLSDLEWGSLDDHGVPGFPVALRCAGTSQHELWNAAIERRSCRPESLAVRSDGTRFVLTIRDPDRLESPLSAIARRPVKVLPPWSSPSWSSHRVMLAAFAGALLLAGAIAVAQARRYHRRGGVLSWTPNEIGGVAVLVDPRARRGGTAYRDAKPLARSQVFVGSYRLAAAHAGLGVRIALALLMVSALVSVVGALAY